MHVAGSLVMALSLLSVFVGADAVGQRRPADEDMSGRRGGDRRGLEEVNVMGQVAKNSSSPRIMAMHLTGDELNYRAVHIHDLDKANIHFGHKDGTRLKIAPDAGRAAYTCSLWVLLALVGFLAVCVSLVSWSASGGAPANSKGFFLGEVSPRGAKKPSIQHGFLSNMPSSGFTLGYVACWAFPLWMIMQLGWWGQAKQKRCDMTGQGWQNNVTAEQPISWVTVMASAVSIAAAAIAVKIGLAHKDADSESSASERSVLLDNCKIGAMICIIFGHIVYYNTDGEYHDYLSWFSGQSGSSYAIAAIEFSINAACFLSGAVMRRPVSVPRFFNLVFDLILPCLLWTYMLKGFMKANFENSSWTFGALTSSVSNVFSLHGYQEEWYLQALIVWRLFSYFTGMLNVPIVFAISCMLGGMSGYTSLWSAHYNFDTAFGFLLMFTMGMLCPLQKLTAKIPSNLMLQVVGVGIMAVFPLVVGLLGPLPDNHLTFAQGGTAEHYKALKVAAGEGSCLAEFNLFWTRRVLKNVLALVPVLAYILLVVPRRRMFMSDLGKHTLYPYLFHEFFNFGRDRLLMAFHLPVSTSAVVHALFYASSLAWSTLVFCACTSRPFRFVFSFCFDFSWLKAHISPSSGNNEHAEPEHPIAQRAIDGRQWTDYHMVKGSVKSKGTTVPANVDASCTDGDQRILSHPFEELEKERAFYELPRMKAAEPFYPLLMYSGLVIIAVFYVGFANFLLPRLVPVFDAWVEFIFVCANCAPAQLYWRYNAIVFSFGIPGVMIVVRMVRQCLRARRLLIGLQPAPCTPSGLMHCVVICTYKEPLAVLRMTIQSLAKQTFDTKQVWIVLATEARDSTAKGSFDALVDEFGPHFGEMMMTVHTLCEGEIAGKSSNENHAVRELYKKLAPTRDPFGVMLTICDVDSLFATRFIEQLDWSYQQYANPGHLLYDSPINTYRNYWDADIFIRAYESFRCQLALGKIWDFCGCQSNYSLTLGLAHEINFWCPDNTPEDIHTTMKVYVHTHGGQPVVPVWSVISNDLVSGWGDRYVQAKRHAWGVTEAMWGLSTYKQIPTMLWLKLFGWLYWDQVGQELVNPVFMVFVPGFWQFIYNMTPMSRLVLFWYLIITYGVKWVEFVAMEVWLWSKILQVGESEHMPSLTPTQKVKLAAGYILYPATSFVSKIVFGTIPRLDSILHSFRSPDLAYITAPKANNTVGTSTKGKVEV